MRRIEASRNNTSPKRPQVRTEGQVPGISEGLLGRFGSTGMAHEIEKRTLARYLERSNLKRTKQREAILEAFLEARGHVTNDQLHQTIRESNPNIGYTTVYRTMKLLCDAGLAQERHFDDGVTRYEVEYQHHDHLVCLRCGKIVEFECKMIETYQEKIAAEYGFRVLNHRHELYGHCANCRDD